jgi:DNA topoisomerase-1
VVRILEKLQRTGIRRLGTPRSGFRYRTAAGRRPSRAELARIRALKVPPAWTDVRVSPAPAAKVQAIGRGRAGRRQ